MNTLANIALRNLTRQKKRTVLLGSAIAFGVMIVTLINGFAGAFSANVAENFSDLMAGHVFVSGSEKGEGGFFGVSAVWSGQGRVLIDRVTVVSEELFREEELVRRGGGMELPDEWLLPPATPARIHVVKGLWWDFFGVSEAAAELGGTELTSSYHAQ
ncbi:MAG TPA: hypothetical protein PLW80_02005, partial [Spirochaetales bacterium]|nr:hypothetical protein [Spirochaetales bacterium]